MTATGFAPSPRPAPAARRVLAQAGFELRLLLRNGEQVVLTVVIPLVLLVGLSRSTFVEIGDAGSPRVQTVVPGILALAVLSTAFTAQAIATGFDRRYGVLRLFGTTPLGRTGLLLGKTLAIGAIIVAQLVVIASVGVAIGWHPHGDPVWVVLLVALGVAAFSGLALLVAGTLRAEATLAVANLIYVLLLLAGGIVVPTDRFPTGAQAVLDLLPTAALADGLRQVLRDGHAPSAAVVGVLAVWAVGSGLLAARFFRWD